MSRAETIWRDLAADGNACVPAGAADAGRNACISYGNLSLPEEAKHTGVSRKAFGEISIRRKSRQRAEKLCEPGVIIS
ncbi:hypothetical protein BRYFOR_08198 [Marvinbryantia formatexigens DSM 14469]|uniref:Uncharacterized protein n=1 Tax=Marvinbryantia formatexigens DSM 14469 TaxID=478749 RepID=C6LHT4_9FIRM|nr:hypothetical protein BRYFOR_08198 [Marvinbryantia formatexigens DSM 14469]